MKMLPECENISKATNRSSHQRCSIKKGVLRSFTKFTGKCLYQSLFFNKVAGLRPATLLRKKLWHRCFPVNFANFLRTPFFRTPLDDCFYTESYNDNAIGNLKINLN